MAKPLTAKQEAFALEYVRNSRNGSDAYRVAFGQGRMSDKSIWEKASHLLAEVKVQARIAELTAPIAAKAEKDLGLTREWVLEQLKEVVAMAKAAEPARDAEGNPIGEYKTNLAAANKALELIGKETHQMFVDRSINVSLHADLDRLSSAEVAEYERAIDGQLAQIDAPRH